VLRAGDGREEVLVRSWVIEGEDLEARFAVGRVEDLLVRRWEGRRVEEVDVRGVEEADAEAGVSEYPESWRDIFMAESLGDEGGGEGEEGCGVVVEAVEGSERGCSSMFEGWSCAEWKVAASEVAETLERD
jgi:hypothetical protein